jgi:hypothetical protein
MSILSSISGPAAIWRWHPTHQRAFDEVKKTVDEWRDHHRTVLDYSEGAERINLVTDACLTGASGYLSQGNVLKTAKVCSFWSGKFNSAQQNYPVHEQELLAIVESLKRFRAELTGAKFRICTDHRGLEYIMNQRHLSPRQHRWLGVLNEFDFEIHYIPGETNILADALSRIYGNEPTGEVRAESEYVQDMDPDDPVPDHIKLAAINLSAPVLTDSSALWMCAIDVSRRSERLGSKPRAEINRSTHQLKGNSEEASVKTTARKTRHAKITPAPMPKEKNSAAAKKPVPIVEPELGEPKADQVSEQAADKRGSGLVVHILPFLMY